MVELFVYNWFYTGYTVYGHCLNKNGNYKLLVVNGFKPSCYVSSGSKLPESEKVSNFKAVCKRMVTSTDISTLQEFYQVFFDNTDDMHAFTSEQRYRSRVYMADIPQINIFLAQINADHVGWVRVNSQKVESPEAVTFIKDMNPYVNPRVMVFDIEVFSQDSGMPRPYRITDKIEMISVVVYNTGNIKDIKVYILHKCESCLFVPEANEVICKDEEELIMKFFDIMKQEDPTIITGFNIYGFDIKYLISRLQLRLIKIPDVSRGLKNSIDVIKIDWTSDAYGHNKYDRLVIGGRVILDMYLYFRRMKLDRYSLDYVSKKFVGEGKHDMPTAEMMDAFRLQDKKTLAKVATYCIQDSILVMKLFDKVQMWIDVCEISKITKCEIENIYTRGEQMKMISQCVRECIVRDIVLQPQPAVSEWKQYDGAYVLEPEKGVYNCCSLLDFQSLYPSIIIAYNICPSTYINKHSYHRVTDKNKIVVNSHAFRTKPIGLLPGMIKSLIEERIYVKNKMKSCDKHSMTYTVLDRRQNALKICANSVYGMMGFKNSKYFGHVGCADSVTSIGRYTLKDIVDRISTNYPVKVIYGDTDSCMLCLDSNRHDGRRHDEEMKRLSNIICNEITVSLPKPMALKLDSYYDKVVLLTKKKYILVKDGVATYKGVMSARRDYCKFAKDMYDGIISMIAMGNDNESIIEYIDEKMFLLVFGQCNISDMVITKSLSKDIRSYKVNQPHVVLAKRLSKKTGTEILPGTRLEYVYISGCSNQAEKMRTPEEVVNENLKIDGKYYIKKQLLTQIDDILSTVGIGTYIQDCWSMC